MTACAAPISGDTYCERTHAIVASAPQIDAMDLGFDLWRSLVQQINAHNEMRKRHC